MGVVFDTNLSSRNSISMIINKENKIFTVIRRSFSTLDTASFALIYKAIVLSHLEYAVIIWNPHKKVTSTTCYNVGQRLFTSYHIMVFILSD